MKVQKFKDATIISSSGVTSVMEELEIRKIPAFITAEYEAPEEPAEDEIFALSAE